MRYMEAKKLLNNDQVTVKETGEVVQVLKTETYEDEKRVLVYAQTGHLGYAAMDHTDVM